MMRILIVDDHAVVRQGLKQILADVFKPAFFGEAPNATEMLHQVRTQDWHAVVLDISMPGRSGLDVLKEIKSIRPRLPVLVLSMHGEDQFAQRALKSGASGYMTKESAPQELVNAIRKVMSGGKYISTALAEKLASALETGLDQPLHATLSSREFQVLRLIVSGKSMKQIAGALSLSVKTVNTFRARLMVKMKMQSTAELTRYAIENHLVE